MNLIQEGKSMTQSSQGELKMTKDSRVFKLKVGRTQIGRDISRERGNEVISSRFNRSGGDIDL